MSFSEYFCGLSCNRSYWRAYALTGLWACAFGLFALIPSLPDQRVEGPLGQMTWILLLDLAGWHRIFLFGGGRRTLGGKPGIRLWLRSWGNSSSLLISWISLVYSRVCYREIHIRLVVSIKCKTMGYNDRSWHLPLLASGISRNQAHAHTEIGGLFLNHQLLVRFGRLDGYSLQGHLEDRTRQSSQHLENLGLFRPHLCKEVSPSRFSRIRNRLMFSSTASAFHEYPWQVYRHNWANLNRIWPHCSWTWRPLPSS